MNTKIVEYLSKIWLGDVQTFENMTIFPVFVSESDEIEYISLGEALEQKVVTITEIDQSGSVPNLKVINHSEQWILLLDGEEIVGAKQNRILNTTILLDKKSELVIPVSCTEQGRWRYSSPEFFHSNVMMSHQARSMKSYSVYKSLLEGRGHSSDQRRVWSDIQKMQIKSGSFSQTQAMKDVYMAKDQELDQYIQTFESKPDQRGCLVFVNGQVMGLDVISKEETYKQIHPQLIKSYAMEALLENKETSSKVTMNDGKNFLEKARKSKELQFKGVGIGKDYRYEVEDIFGSALVFNEHVIHLTFFKNWETTESDGG
ncbi:MAG: hypothetical protein DWQ04_09295 [Chloroflexi bacterium]|nr:MAG: hypothetical protein DWQ04_09295 [Chloroflexota bacterium]